MQKVSPFIWFEKEARDAADFYKSIFPDTSEKLTESYDDTPSGTTDIILMKIMGLDISLMNAGKHDKINPSISFMVNFDPKFMEGADTKIDEVWGKLIEGGKILMPFDKYPFAEKYGWVEDKFGVSWQLILSDSTGDDRPGIMPALLFVNKVAGRAGEAKDFYLKVFKDSKEGLIAKYPNGMEPNKEGDVMFSDFKLYENWFVAMDSRDKHEFEFNDAISFIIDCRDQEEVDYYWDSLLENGEESQCGWLIDKFGVRWQVVPSRLNELLRDPDKEKSDRVMQCMLEQKKIIIEELERAYEGK